MNGKVKNVKLNKGEMKSKSVYTKVFVDKKRNLRYTCMLNSKGKVIGVVGCYDITEQVHCILPKEYKEDIIEMLNNWSGYNSGASLLRGVGTFVTSSCVGLMIGAYASWVYR